MRSLFDVTPYLAGIVSAFVAFFTYRESKRKTKHDEAMDLYDKVNADNERLRKENDQLRQELEDLKNGK